VKINAFLLGNVGFGNTFRRKEMESRRGRSKKRWTDRIKNYKEI